MTQETCLSIAGVHNENVLAGTTLVVKLEPHSTLPTINIYLLQPLPPLYAVEFHLTSSTICTGSTRKHPVNCMIKI